ncbi:MAG: Gfo/Idh/MocA family oxidoreductase [Clostridia bacterium]|nr:Gfo/Idh/MocA family oxidoreductase [Clostridia bacterium]
MDKVRLGIIGIGNMGTTHAKNISGGKVPGMEMAALCDISEQRAAYVKETYPEIPFFSDSHELITSGLVDVVIVAVPHYDHSTIAIDAFENGLNVITEKPAGVYTKQVLEMNEAAKKSGKLFGIMYNQRTNPVYGKLKQLIDSGELGAIKRVSWIITDWYRSQFYHDSCTWRSTWKTEGGGALINQNPHQLDLWQWLFGMPDRIMSHVSFGKYYDIEVEDDVTAFFEYENGMTGTYITSTGEAPGTNRLEIACDMGRVVVENNIISFKRNVVSEREFNKTNKLVFGCPECWDCKIPTGSQTEDQHVYIFRDFTAALLHGKKLLAPGEEGIKGLTISNAIHYSAWTGGWADVKNFPHDEFYRLLQEKIKNSTVVKKDIQITAGTEDTY